MNEVLHIEICKAWSDGKWNIRIGDLKGSTERSNVDDDELIEDLIFEVQCFKEQLEKEY